ncbi:MAG: DUF4493 domain-containing protein [Bacteroides sp.]|nr:DUF4493 domain-containing protein [Bacteroides sp.]
MKTIMHDSHFINKKDRLLRIMTIAAVSAAATSCSDDKINVGTGSGSLNPVVNVDPTIIPAVDPQHPIECEIAPEGTDMLLRLTDVLTGAETTWENQNHLLQTEVFLPGDYIIEASYGNGEQEGFDHPYYYGTTSFKLANGETARPEIVASVKSTVIKIDYDDTYRRLLKNYTTVLHSDGGIYLNYPATERRYAYLLPGEISFTLQIEMNDGRKATFQPVKVSDAKRGYLYRATLSAIEGENGSAPKIVISFDDKILTDDVTVTLSDAFFNSEAPAVKPYGFTNGDEMILCEGALPDEPVGFEVTSDDLNALMLTTTANSLIEKGWPAEIDLLNMNTADAAKLESFGVKLNGIKAGLNNGSTVDLTEAMRALRYDEEQPVVTFTLQARNRSSKVSDPVTLKVEVEPVDLTVTNWTPAIVGVNKAEIRVKCPSSAIKDNVVIEAMDARGHWTTLKITEIEAKEGSIYAVRFNVPAGNEDSINLRVIYCGEVKQTFAIKRESPNFTIEVDAFALSAKVRIVPENPELRSVITSCMSVYVSDRKILNLERDTEEGTILVSGLAQSTKYSFRGTVMDTPTEAQFTPAVEVTTETCVQLPNSDFEDVKNTIDYPDMLSGGRYSQTVVGIFNLQNHTTFTLSAPKSWANVNDKTFCTGAKNHNTWYMAPSTYTVTDAYQGAYAVRLDNVGWDIDGAEIPDYRQPAPPYTTYSMEIPEIANRSTGRLFLGSYSFDPITGAETYSEGTKINSRPAAVSGFYKYTPGPNNPTDKGIVTVEVTGLINGVETVIAKGRSELETSLSYKTFSVELQYELFGVKANQLKVMFASSTSMGDIKTESADVVTYDDPVTSTSRGSSLWIDAISLSY